MRRTIARLCAMRKECSIPLMPIV